MRGLGKARIVAALILAGVSLRAAPGQAHSFPDHADPKVGATLSAAPPLVRIWFDGALEPPFCVIMVHDESNRMIDRRDGRVDPADPTLLEVSLPLLPPGVYRVYWDVVSRDGHRTTGDYRFTVRPGP